MKHIPIGDRVLCSRTETRLADGIEIPDVGLDDLTATVVAVGNGRLDAKGNVIPVDLKVGDKVLFPRGSGTIITIDGKEFWLFGMDELLAVLE